MPNEPGASLSPGRPIGFPKPINKLRINTIRGVQRDLARCATAAEVAGGHQTFAETLLS